jgi:hypothetical protein
MRFSEVPQFLLEEYFGIIERSFSIDGSSPEGEVLRLNDRVRFVEGFVSFSPEGERGGEMPDNFDFIPEYNTREARIDRPRSYLRGGGSGIMVRGGEWTRMFAKVTRDQLRRLDETGEVINYAFKEVKMKPLNGGWLEERNLFVFSKQGTRDFTPGPPLPAPTETPYFRMVRFDKTPYEQVTLEPGQELYLRNDSFFHTWFRESKGAEFANFFNDRRLFSYLGPAFIRMTGEEEAKNDVWHMPHLGMKDSAVRMIPENLRNDRLTEFLYTFFDRVYQEGYSLQKEIGAMMDPAEAGADFIGYILRSSGLNIDEYRIEEVRQRDLIKNLAHLLKGKGTYSSLFQVWKSVVRETANDLVIYERWHDDLKKLVFTLRVNMNVGRWRVDGGEWMYPGARIDLLRGQYTVSFEDVPGYVTPEDHTFDGFFNVNLTFTYDPL